MKQDERIIGQVSFIKNKEKKQNIAIIFRNIIADRVTRCARKEIVNTDVCTVLGIFDITVELIPNQVMCLNSRNINKGY